MKVSNEAKTLAELVAFLRDEQNHSIRSLAVKIGVSATTLHSILAGEIPSNKAILEKIAIYAGITQSRIWQIAWGVEFRSRYTPTVEAMAELLEQLSAQSQRLLLIQIRATVAYERKEKRDVF